MVWRGWRTSVVGVVAGASGCGQDLSETRKVWGLDLAFSIVITSVVIPFEHFIISANKVFIVLFLRCLGNTLRLTKSRCSTY